MKTYHPAVDISVKRLLDMIDKGQIAQGEVLPPVRTLARTCGTSVMTMQKAIAALRKTGHIAGERRRRPRVAATIPVSGPPAPQPSPGKLPTTTVSRIEAELRREILLGDFVPSIPFPSLKELLGRFGSSPRTMHQVLSRLNESGLTEPHGRWHRVRIQGSRRASARLALIGFTNGPDNAIIRAHHDDYVRNPLQTECWRRNLLLENVGCPIETCTELYGMDSRRKFTFDEGIVGCIFLLNQITDKWPNIFRMLASLRIPVAIIDEFGSWDVHEYFPDNGKVRVFSFSAGRSSARDITRILLGYGHRKFAFISPFKSLPWSTVRKDSIREELAHAGLEENLQTIEFDADDLMEEPGVSELLKEAHGKIDRVLSEYPQAIQDAYAHVFDLRPWSRYHGERSIEKHLRAVLQPLCKKRDITAWIAVNDLTALFALDVLRKNGLNLPADVSLVSFDNSTIAQDTRISSSDFNGPGLITAALNFIVSSFDRRLTFPTERVEIPGILVERASVGPAPSSRR